ncbi:antitoxin (DNA-binding transcriptional repressor) of toxin-antitoxin stability system [Clostridiales Family XIII bacterium PM5-7]
MNTHDKSNTIPISRFHKGEIATILDDVKAHGPRIVTKYNRPIAVMISVPDYICLINDLLHSAKDPTFDINITSISDELYQLWDFLTTVSKDTK